MSNITSVKGIIYALISSSTFGLIPLFSLPLMNDDNMGLPSILFYRFFFSSIIMGAICLAKKEKLSLPKENITPVFVLGVLYAITALFLVYSYKFIPSGVAVTIHFLYPIFVSFLMIMFFKEKKSIILIISAILSLIGVGLLCWTNEGGINLWGVAVASVTIISYAVYIVGINKSSASSMGAEALTFYILLTGCLLFGVYAISTTGIEAIPSSIAWWRLLFLAFLPTVLSDFTLILAIKYAGSTITSILGSMEPLVAVLVGVFCFSEYFGFNSFIGLLLILGSVILVILFTNKPKDETASDTVSNL